MCINVRQELKFTHFQKIYDSELEFFINMRSELKIYSNRLRSKLFVFLFGRPGEMAPTNKKFSSTNIHFLLRVHYFLVKVIWLVNGSFICCCWFFCFVFFLLPYPHPTDHLIKVPWGSG